MKGATAQPPMPTVLLVDDDPQFLRDLRDLLVRGIPGLNVVTADSGAAGLKALREQAIDVVISDQQMPKMDGLQFLAAAMKDHPDVPRIMLTGYPMFDTAMEAVNRAHVDDFIPKPPEAQRTLQTVRKALIERDLRKQSHQR